MRSRLVGMDRSLGLSRWLEQRCAMVLLVACFSLVCSSPVLAQLDTGTISGSVTDQSGAAVPRVTVTIKNVQTGTSRSWVTNDAGRYVADALPVGNYDVSASLMGFQTEVRSGIVLTVGQNAVVDMALQVGNVTQAVTVQGDVSQVETTTASVSNLVTQTQVLEIPLNNRDLTQLTYFTPGVLKVPLIINTNYSNSAIGGTGDKLSVNGSRAEQNLYLLDGIPNSDSSGNPQAVSGAYSGAETVREFQVITNSYSAEYPSVTGAIVSAVTKSGTNALHGSLFEFLRNEKLDAAKWEDNHFGRAKPAFRRNQFGGSVGGRIVKDHTFFFASYEGLRQNQSSTVTFTTITAGPRAGSLGPVSPVVAPYLPLWPLPGQQGTTLITDFGDGRAMVAGTASRPLNDDYVSFKLDHQFTSQKKGMLAFYYLRDAGKADNIDAYQASGGNTRQLSHTNLLSVHHTSILSSTMLNDFLFGYTTTDPEAGIPISPINFSSFNGVNLTFNPSAPQEMGSIGISNVAGVGYAGGLNAPQHNTLTWKEGMSLVHQKHSFKFGAQIQNYQDHVLTSTNDTFGGYSFTSLTNFLQAKPQNLTVNLPDGTPVLGLIVHSDPLFDLRQWTYGLYFQDNYAIFPSLTLTAGLRYEFATNPTETSNHLNSFRSVLGTQIITGQPLYLNPTLKNFSPRLGLAWSPGSHKLSVRAGGGVYFEAPSLFSTQFNFAQMIPYGVVGSATDATSSGMLQFPNAVTTQPQLLASTPDARVMEYNMKSAATYRWSLSVERELGPWIITAGYTGSRTEHLLLSMEANMSRWTGYPNPVPSFQKTFLLANGRINPLFGRITISTPRGDAHYEGLTVNASRRLTKGLQFQGGYTLSKAVDDGASSVNVQDSVAQGVRTSYYWDQGLLEGPSLFDIRNNFVGNFTYDLPKVNRTGFEGAVANGWQLSGVLTLSQGFHFSLSDSGNAAQTAQFYHIESLRPNLIPGGNPDPILGGPNMYYDPTQFVPSTCSGSTVCKVGDPTYSVGHFGNLPFNSLVGPGSATLDFSILKNVNVTETSHFQFRAEAFNLFNHANFFLPNASPFLSNGTRDPTAGMITQTRTTARQIQFALKYIF